MKLSDEEIDAELHTAYEHAGSNAYFGSGFRMGVEFAENAHNARIDALLDKVRDDIKEYTQKYRKMASPLCKDIIDGLEYQRSILENILKERDGMKYSEDAIHHLDDSVKSIRKLILDIAIGKAIHDKRERVLKSDIDYAIDELECDGRNL